ncbi:carboxylesterase family protein [Streptomyces mirabilis]|nr:carboxylesterase family protein [Streptomyces mirabilis]
MGPSRLRLPRRAEPWAGARRDGVRGTRPQPPMPVPAGAAGPTDAPVLPEPSEDCLYVNVTAPADAGGLPVLLWIHGGGYQVGTGSDIAGDGRTFARRHGVVVVTFNYRLGALGFLAVDGEEHTGAFGLHDQIAALRWVRENIAGFGGDPDRITLYGLSAGAKSVANLLASPLTRGMIHRAASSSGGADHIADRDQDAAITRRFLRTLGAGTRHLRKVSAEGSSPRRPCWARARGPAGCGARPRRSRPHRQAVGRHRGGRRRGDPTAGADVRQRMRPLPTAGSRRGRAGRPRAGGVLRYRRARPDPRRVHRGASRTRPRSDPVAGRPHDRRTVRHPLDPPRRRPVRARPVWRSRYDVPLTGLPPAVAPSGALPAMHGTDGDAVWLGGRGVNQRLHEAWAAFVTTGVPTAEGLPSWPAYGVARRPPWSSTRPGPTLDDPRGAQRAVWDGRLWQSGTWWTLDDIAGHG